MVVSKRLGASLCLVFSLSACAGVDGAGSMGWSMDGGARDGGSWRQESAHLAAQHGFVAREVGRVRAADLPGEILAHRMIVKQMPADDAIDHAMRWLDDNLPYCEDIEIGHRFQTLDRALARGCADCEEQALALEAILSAVPGMNVELTSYVSGERRQHVEVIARHGDAMWLIDPERAKVRSFATY